MFIEKLITSDAQLLADYLYEDREACYYPENAKFELRNNKALYLVCDGYEKNTNNELLLRDFSIVDFSPCKYMNLEDKYRQFMAHKFGEEYIKLYHEKIDKLLRENSLELYN